jgi:choline dehydrogenase-like flavoprotein
LAVAVKRVDALMQLLQAKGLAGKRIEPPIEVDPKLDVFNDDAMLKQWIKHGTWTVYHWCSTCKAGKGAFGHVADEQFRVRRGLGADAVIGNLYVSSASCLPEIPEANPHLSVTAFSVALADGLIAKYQTQLRGKSSAPAMMEEARRGAAGVVGDLPCRAPGEEVPSLRKTAVAYSASYDACHKD